MVVRRALAMSASGKDNGPSVFTALALLGQLGVVVAAPIVLAGVVGKYADAWLHGHGLVLLGMMLLGVAGGIYGAYRLLAKEL